MTDTPDTLTEPQKLWVAALRSGKYKQTTHVLCRLDEQGEPVGYCCLGVACELAREAGVEVEAKTDTLEVWEGDERVRIPCRGYGGDRENLPAPVATWLGLNSTSGRIVGTSSLAGHNDSGETFERIADIIESRPTGLFVEPS